METILISPILARPEYVEKMESLNPFYIMETILIFSVFGLYWDNLASLS